MISFIFINICFNYGGQTEIADALKKILSLDIKDAEVTTDLIRQNLYHPELPAVDYIVRTSGEQRLSNFLLWESAYAELKFVDVHWPAFSSKDLDSILDDYQARTRRFGK